MDKRKLIPYIITGILLIIGIILFINIKKNSVVFERLIVSFNSQKQEYRDLELDQVIIVNNTSFWVVSINRKEIVLNSSDVLSIGETKSNEIKVELNTTTKVCFENGTCATLQLL